MFAASKESGSLRVFARGALGFDELFRGGEFYSILRGDVWVVGLLIINGDGGGGG